MKKPDQQIQLVSLPEPIKFSDMVKKDLKPNPVLIEGCLYQGGKMMIAAPSKARKSWLLMDLCGAVASGANWFGMETLKTPVLFVNLELFEFDAHNRMKEICEARKYQSYDNLHFWNLRGKRVSFASLKEPMSKYCEKHGIGMIALDPYYRLGEGRDENSNGEIAEFLIQLGEIADDLNVAIVITHHFAKGNSGNKASIDRMSGAGAFARDPDALFMMTEQENNTSENPIFVSEITVRSFAPIKPFGLRWNHPVWEQDDTLGTKLKGSPGRPKASGTVEDILSLFEKDEEVPVGDLQSLADKDFGILRSRFYELIKEAIEDGKLVNYKKGKNSFYKLNPSNVSKNNIETFETAKQKESA